jgi:hypothetical protein
MDLLAIKKKLESLNSQGYEKKDDKKSLFWSPKVGKHVVRIVPSKYNEAMPFIEMLFYYGIGKKTLASPANWDEKDPIMAFTKELRKESTSEAWKMAKKLDPKTRIFAPVIVRGEEDEGVRLWQFGKLVYQDFLNMAADEEIGDYTDVADGRDVKLTTVGPEVTGTDYNKTTISPSLKTSPLDKDDKVVKQWLEDQPDPKGIFKKHGFDEIKEFLQDYLSPEEEGDEEATSTVSKPENYSLNVKKTNSDKFDDLFKG